MDFNHYYTNDELSRLIDEWVSAYPSLLRVSTIGMSHEERPIWLLAITNQDTGTDREKPAVWIDANLHATEITGTTAALYIAYHLLSGYGTDRQVTRQLDQGAYYIVPRINPDGAAWAMAAKPRYVRSGVRPYPWEEKDAGLFAQDINQDGKILQMRLQDPNGDWKVSSLDPRLMEKRLPTDNGGAFYRLFPEGLLEDYDGYVIKMARPQEGLDFNRNFPFQWRAENEQDGAGPYPASEPETHALADFVTGHPNISFAITFHTSSRVILRPYSTKADEDMNTEDLWVYKKVGEIGTKLTGYRCVSTFHDFKYHPKEVTTGAFDDWMYDRFGAFTYTIELWDLPTEAGIADRKFIEWWREHPHEQDLQILKWVDEHADPDAYVEWQPYDHPQLGKIELGGWNSMYTWRNPPHAFVESEVKRHFPFILSLGEMLPHLAVHALEVDKISADQFHVNLVVENTGFLPTFTSQQGKARQATRPVRVELELPVGVVLASGKRREEMGHLEGRSNKLDVTASSTESPTDNRARLEWVIQAPAGTKIVVKIMSERAGAISREVTLE